MCSHSKRNYSKSGSFPRKTRIPRHAWSQFSEVSFELRWRRIDLATLGGKGKAYRLSIQSLLEVRK